MHGPRAYLLLYRERIDSDGDAAAAFGHLVALTGALLGAVGICIFLVGSHLGDASGRWLLREAGIALAATALPILLYGDVVRLPLRESETLPATAGVVLTLVAVVQFVLNYPYNWFVPGGATLAVSLYATGLALVVAVETVVPLLTDAENEPAADTPHTEVETDDLNE